jgi:hypothetical protein
LSERISATNNGILPIRRGRSERKGTAMQTTNSIPLSRAARAIGTAPSVLRRALNRFSINEKQNGQRVIPAEVVRLFAQTRRQSGYLYPRGIDTRQALLRAANAQCGEGHAA